MLIRTRLITTVSVLARLCALGPTSAKTIFPAATSPKPPSIDDGARVDAFNHFCNFDFQELNYDG